MLQCSYQDDTLIPKRGNGGTLLPMSQSGTLIELGTMVINNDVDEQTMKS